MSVRWERGPRRTIVALPLVAGAAGGGRCRHAPGAAEQVEVAMKKEAQRDAGRAPEPRTAERVRNVVLVGHAGAGKTTLVEALLARTGTIPRAGRVEDGTTVCDNDEVEVRQQRSVALALAPLEYDGIKVNLLDTPGYADFVG